jgi:predicted nucleotidyltransferase
MKTLAADALDEAVARLVAEFNPESIYLFGSHAWGTATENSDVDLFVVVAESEETSVARSQRALRILSDLPFAKDVLIGTRAEIDRFKHLRASLTHQVLNRGRKLYG